MQCAEGAVTIVEWADSPAGTHVMQVVLRAITLHAPDSVRALSLGMERVNNE
jgi:hypothetical protein